MKKKLLFVVLCFMSITASLAAPRFWVGGASGVWNSAANWSATSGGAGGAGVPGSTDDVTFDTDAVVDVSLASVGVRSVKVTNNRVVKLWTNTTTVLTVTGNGGTPGLDIDAGSTLRDSTNGVNPFTFVFSGSSTATGAIDGTWLLAGSEDAPGPRFQVQNGANVQVGGTITMNPFATFIDVVSGGTLSFNASSNLNLACDGGIVPSNATFNTTSTINVTGSVVSLPSFFAAPGSYGNLIINTPGLDDDKSLALTDGTVIKGNLQVLNTNSRKLTLLSNIGSSPISSTVNGNVTISGTGTTVVMSTDDLGSSGTGFTFDVDGSFTLTNGNFSLQDANGVTGVSTLIIGGNVAHTGAGYFTANSTASSSSTNYFIVELDGAAAQTFSTSAGTINNAQNMVALRINNSNATGVTLNSPLIVGRIDFSAGKINTTSTNLLTINDPANSSVVVNNPSTTRYVNGPVRRSMNAATEYLIPTGKGSNYHSIQATLNSATLSVYTFEYFNTGYGDYTVALPLTGVSNTEYWNVAKTSGEDLKIRLSLIGTAVPGADGLDGVVVARFSTGAWRTVRGLAGTLIQPGNSTTGNTFSDTQLFNGDYTFGFGPASVVPVKLINFTAQKIAATARIDWEVDAATIPAAFEVLKSADGRNFNTVATVAGINNTTRYQITDNDLYKGLNYYRLKLVEKDGTIGLSKVVAVMNNDNGVALTSLLPTLVTSQAKVSIAAGIGGHLELVVTDMQGRTWRKLGTTVSAGNTDLWLDFSNLSAGTYQVTGYMNGNKTTTLRFVKQ